jgi:hypothetical protein
MPINTLLDITGIPMGDYSVRGLKMSLTPEPANNGLQRASSGLLLDLTATQMRKFTASITCSDVQAPDFTNVWQGTPVTVLSVPDVGQGNDIAVTMNMLVDNWTVERDEWGCVSSWSLALRQT